MTVKGSRFHVVHMCLYVSVYAADNDQEDVESLYDRKDGQEEHIVLHYYINNCQLTFFNPILNKTLIFD